MRPFTILTIIAVTIVPFSCKKNDYRPPNSMRSDPYVNETFGRRLELDEPNPPVVWSNDSRKLFVTTGQGTYLMNIADDSKELILPIKYNAFVVQVSPDDKEIIFLGDVNRRFGYYKMNVSTREITALIQFTKQKSTAVYVGSQGMFVYQGDVVSAGQPCELWDDFFCGVYTTTINLTLKYKRFDNDVEVSLRPDVRFENYSPDGKQAILSMGDTYFLFNTTRQSFEDSFVLPPTPTYGNFHWINNTIQYPTFQSGSSDIVIMAVKNNQEVKRFTTAMLITEFIGWPAKSNKIFYTGACNIPGCIYAINELDLTTMTERQIVSTSAPDLATSPFQVKPSPDGNSIVFNDGFATYIKPVN